MAAAVGKVSSVSCCQCSLSRSPGTKPTSAQYTNGGFTIFADLRLPRRKSYLSGRSYSGFHSKTSFGQRSAPGSIKADSRDAQVRFQAVQGFSSNGRILLERTSHGQGNTPPFATVSVVPRQAGLPPPKASEGLITDGGPVGILEPEEMELWLSEVEWVDPRVDIDPVSISRAARLQMKADAAASIASAPRNFVASVRKLLPPSIGGSPQRLTAFSAGILLVLALLWALFRKKAPQPGAANAAFGNSPPGTGPSGVAKSSGGQYLALKGANADVSYKVGQAGSVAKDVKDEAAKKAQESMADLQKRVRNVRQADDKLGQAKKEVKEELEAGRKTVKELVRDAEKRMEGSAGRNGTGDSQRSSGGVWTQPAKGGAREDGSSGRSGTGDSLKTGVGKTIISGVKGAPTKANEQLVKNSVGEPAEKASAGTGDSLKSIISGVKKARTGGDSGVSGAVISGVKGAPTKANEQLVKSAVGDPTDKLSAAPLPEKKETEAPPAAEHPFWASKKKQDSAGSGVEGSDPKQLETLVKATVGKPTETEQQSKPAGAGASPFQANSADALLGRATQKPENGAGVTAPKTPLQVNSADSVLSGAQKSPSFVKPGGDLASEVAGLSELLKKGEKPRADQLAAKGSSSGAGDVASLMSELSEVMQAGKKTVAASRKGSDSDTSSGVISTTPATPLDGPGAKTLAANGTKTDVISQTPPKPLGGSPETPKAKAGGSEAISRTPPTPVANVTTQAPKPAEAPKSAKPVEAAKPVESSGSTEEKNGFFNVLPWMRRDGSDKPAIPAASGSSDVISKTPASSAAAPVSTKPSPGQAPATAAEKQTASVSTKPAPVKPPSTVAGSAGSGPGKQTAGKPADVTSPPAKSPASGEQRPKQSEASPKTERRFGWFSGKNETLFTAEMLAEVDEKVPVPAVRETPLPPVVSERAPLAVAEETPPLPVFEEKAVQAVRSGAAKAAETGSDAEARTEAERLDDAREAQEILTKILVEDLPLPKARKERAQLVAKIQNVLPAVAMSMGAAGAFTAGLDGALETVGFAALASFSYSTLLWASNRENLKKDIEEIKSSKDLVEFLKEKDITPEI